MTLIVMFFLVIFGLFICTLSKPRSLQQKQVAYENRTETVDRNYHAIAEDLR